MPHFPRATEVPEKKQWPVASSFPVRGVTNIVPAVALVDAWRSDLSCSTASWIGQVNGKTFVQGAGAPSYAVDGGIGRPALTFDGASSSMNCSFAVGAPFFVWAIIRQNAWASNAVLMSGGAGTSCVIYQWAGTTSPRFVQSNGVNVNSNAGAPIGQWKRIAVWFSDSVDDYTLAGSSRAAAAANSGSGTDSSYWIGAYSGGLFGSLSIAELVISRERFTQNQLDKLDAYATTLYGSSIIT